MKSSGKKSTGKVIDEVEVKSNMIKIAVAVILVGIIGLAIYLDARPAEKANDVVETAQQQNGLTGEVEKKIEEEKTTKDLTSEQVKDQRSVVMPIVEEKKAVEKPKGETKSMTSEIVSVNVKTLAGDIKLELYPELMPITVENFVELMKKGFYDGLTFHRVEDWVIQGGDPNGNGTGGSDKTIKLETNPKLTNVRGALAMARSLDPDSASSQFYILKTDASWLDGDYAVFGKVISGMDVVDKVRMGEKIVKVEEVK